MTDEDTSRRAILFGGLAAALGGFGYTQRDDILALDPRTEEADLTDLYLQNPDGQDIDGERVWIGDEIVAGVTASSVDHAVEQDLWLSMSGEGNWVDIESKFIELEPGEVQGIEFEHELDEEDSMIEKPGEYEVLVGETTAGELMITPLELIDSSVPSEIFGGETLEIKTDILNHDTENTIETTISLLFDGTEEQSKETEFPKDTTETVVFDHETEEVEDETEEYQITPAVRYHGHKHTLDTVDVVEAFYLYSGGWDNDLYRTHPQTMEVIDAYTGHDSNIYSVWSDGEYLYTGALDEMHRLDPISLNYVDSFTGAGSAINDIWGDGDYLYLVSRDDYLYKLEWDSLEEDDSKYYGGSAYGVWGDGDYIYTNAYESGLQKLDPGTLGVQNTYYPRGSDITGYGDYLYTVVYDDGAEVHKVDTSTMSEQGVYEEGQCIWTDGNYLFAGTEDGEVHKIDVDTMEKTDHPTFDDGLYEITAIYGNDTYLYAGGDEGHLYMIDRKTMDQVEKIDPHSSSEINDILLF